MAHIIHIKLGDIYIPRYFRGLKPLLWCKKTMFIFDIKVSEKNTLIS